MMKKTSLYALLVLLFAGLLSGCLSNVPQMLAPANQASSVVHPVDEYGNLRLVVRWPNRNLPGYQTQLIPLTTNSLVIWVRQGETELARQVVTRNEGTETATASFRLKAANNLSVEVKAYRELTPNENVNTAIAQGTTNANITRSKLTMASVILDATFVPQIDSLSSNAGVASDSVTLNGDYFGETGIPVEVSFNGTLVPPADINRISSKSITVKVPVGASTGKVIVKADGVSSTSNMYYWVAKALEIGAPKASWDTFTPPFVRVVLLNKTLDFSATPSWEVNGGDSLELYGSAPQPTWTADGPVVGSISPTGRYTASGVFGPPAIVVGHLGSLPSPPILVQQEGVQLVMNPPSTLFGGRGLRTIPMNAMHIFTSGATTSAGIRLEPTQTFIQIVDGVGICNGFVAGGSARIWGYSDIEPSLVATIDVVLSNYGSELLAGSSNQEVKDGTGINARFMTPSHMAIGSDKTLYVVDGESKQYIRKISQYGVVSTATPSHSVTAMTMGPDDTLYIAAYNKVFTVDKITGDATFLAGSDTTGFNDGTGTEAKFNSIQGLAADIDNLYVADTNNQRIRKVTKAGVVTTLAGDGIQGSTNNTDPLLARFLYPSEMTCDQDGNLYVWDQNNFAIRKIASTGVVSTVRVIGPGTHLYGLCVGSDKMLYGAYSTYVTGAGDVYGIYKITPAGDCFSIAGGGDTGYLEGGGNLAKYNFSGGTGGLSIDSSGNLYVSDSGNYRVRKLQ